MRVIPATEAGIVMTATNDPMVRSRIAHGAPRSRRLAAAVAAALCTAATAFGQVPIILPGAPGEPSRVITPEEATDLAGVRFSAADVRFTQGMIVHHAQALEMTTLVSGRTNREAVRLLAERIELSQEDEMGMMQGWLRERGLDAPEATAHTGHDTELMPGMATAEQMAALAEANGAAFDTLFLELMIEHHKGALTMVDELLEEPSSAQDAVLYEFTQDVRTDQRSEIERMDGMLAGFSPDPRVALKAGFEDAAHASLNMELVVSLPKPAGFFDPEHPAGRPMERERNPWGDGAEAEDDGEEAADDGAAVAAANDEDNSNSDNEQDDGDERSEPRPSLLSFANTDLVFAGDVLIAGNYHGFNAYDISDPHAPALVSSVVAHNGSLVPIPGRDVFVQAWYQGGISVIDFTESAHPVEIAFFDRGPVDEKDLFMGGYWSAYWYGGFVYGTEIARGLDVLALTPSSYLSENELAAAAVASHGAVVNPQQQRRHDWPAEPVVAQAYVDQLTRGLELDASRAAAMEQLADRLR